jgi:UDP-N-acetylglucosamine:LPS N-acetylglucosamine transferase
MRPEHIVGKKVLYGCLDWGSGHVARSIPLILQLQQQGNHVFFFGSRWQMDILEQYGFTGTCKELPPTGFRFKGDGNFLFEGLRNVRTLQTAIRRDHERTVAYATTHKMDLIISDHRYGVYSDTIPSVFVTHQVQLPPKTNWLAQRIHRKWMARFETIWIMDEADAPLAGVLSQPVQNAICIGHYSRFSKSFPKAESSGRIAAIISGPEPYAQQLFDAVCDLAATSRFHWTIICSGAYAEGKQTENARIIRQDWKTADQAIVEADLVVSRNGYSTLMDLKTLHKKAVFLPTPGQPEQLYLQTVNRNASWCYVNSAEELKHVVGQLSMK